MFVCGCHGGVAVPLSRCQREEDAAVKRQRAGHGQECPSPGKSHAAEYAQGAFDSAKKGNGMGADAAERKKARAQWTGRLLCLAESDEQDMTSLTVHQRLCELYALSQRAFALSGKPWPQYTRATMPGRLCTLAESDDD